MSEFLHKAVTPCPRRLGSSILGDRGSDVNVSSIDSLWNSTLGDCDDTGNIEFTTEIRAPVLTGVKPRRRNKTSTSFAIHNDREKRLAEAAIPLKQEIKPIIGPDNRKSSLLAQPAQRFRPRVSFAPSPPKHSQKKGVENRKQETRSDLHRNNELLKEINGHENGTRIQGTLKKNVCQSTVYLPPDDTTVASVFMGIFSPLRPRNPKQQTQQPTEVGKLETQVANLQLANQSLASSPQRAPLQPSSKVAQESCNRIDILGKNGGKENIPPGMVRANINDENTDPVKPIKVPGDKLATLNRNADPVRRLRTSINTVGRPLAAKTVNGPPQRSVCNARSNIKTSSVRGSQIDGKKKTLNTGHEAPSTRPQTTSNSLKGSKTGLKSSISRNSLRDVSSEYPLILENITNPTMYDDNWLFHQEVILTQLINGLFEHTDGDAAFGDPTILRHEFLILYQSAPITNLYKRIQASILYGALSIPKDVLLRNGRLRQDLGMKRKFLDFWLQTYDTRALQAALETIIGRRIVSPKGALKSSNGSLDSSSQSKGKSTQKRVEMFLDTFLIQNQDMDRQSKDPEAPGKAYHRTVLRSIMMVILLDKAKMCHRNAVPGCLFLASSPYKSSVAVLQALARFLIPSSGDVVKALGQLDCRLLYRQSPLAEYEYGVSNLAVDLRDGVRLTRIVELLFYPSAPRVADAGLNVPESEKSSIFPTRDGQWPLSQSLKFPCLSRAVKLFNIRIALNALASTKGATALVSHIRAEDIVDGHREKTIALLWGMVSKWGLSELIDFNDVRKEIARLREKLGDRFGSEPVEVGHQSDEPTVLLKQWAFLVARLKGHQLENLTTVFSDGRIYESLVDEYEGYILGSNQNAQLTGSKTSLQSRLRALGCNSQFVNLVCPRISQQAHFLDADFTIGVLTFLCSRLLSASKRVRAATVLQDAWRRVLTHRDQQRRLRAREVAMQCAAVVQTRERILWAKGVIVQWWRSVKTRQRRKKAALVRKPSRVPLRRYRK